MPHLLRRTVHRGLHAKVYTGCLLYTSSDGTDVLIPGIMEHIERAGVHSGDSIAVYPPYNLTDKMTETVIYCSEKLALALGTRGRCV